ncbi:chromosomal replication initiator protein DnaA [Mannheimia indoligenes]|uniref:chromosomal replication initiator protein DnaA n=1 Tax=Mannheimia indoligenes TaxID=3103145 RepID=UPI002FE5F3EA
MEQIVSSLWSDCLNHLQTKVSPTDYSTWLRPLQAGSDNGELTLYAQNQFVENWVKDKFLSEITELARFLSKNDNLVVNLKVGIKPAEQAKPQISSKNELSEFSNTGFKTGLNPHQTFDNFVQGRSNQLAKLVAQQVVDNLGESHCNPLSFYAGTGLGKTHLLHAIGNELVKRNPTVRVLYIHLERFYRDIIKAINSSNNDAEKIKKFYRSLDVLMIDDIQFLANKPKVQEEFLHLLNALFEQRKQIILTSDVLPKNIDKIDTAIKSRLSGGISATIEPPELETRVAILRQKALERGADLQEDAAYLMGQKLRTNVRELEGALNRVIAWQKLTLRPITVDAVRETLQDLFASFDYLITIENIQRIVAEYYGIKVADIKSKSRARSVARPRQIAMALAKELTNHSLPEIGREFGGRDHTTVLHACKTISELRDTESGIQEDYINLTRKLSS